MSNIFIKVDNEINLIIINEEIITDIKLIEKVDDIQPIFIENMDNIQNPTFNKYNNELINRCFTLLPVLINKLNLDNYDTFKIMFETNQFIEENDMYFNNPNYEYIWITFNKLVEYKNKISYNVFTSYNLILEDYNKTFISKSSEPQTTKYYREKYIMPIKKIMITNSYNDYITINNNDYDIISHNLIIDINKNSITIC